ncbi:MAG: DUF4249 domain-containing protein [Bacteroidales bacterium]|nr:DUF4249 domain-containing protein [Bacteroidales bacterium]
MKPIQILTGLLVVILCTSCEKDIEFTGETEEPMLVINSFITPDSVITANITKSKFFLDENDDSGNFITVENAEVRVYVNDVFKEKMSYVSNGNYKASFAPAIGETIKLEVSAPGLNTAWCETKMEDAAQIIVLDSTSKTMESYPISNGYYDETPASGTEDTIGYYYKIRYDFSLHFKDQESGQNYYRLLVKLVTTYDGNYNSENYDFDFTDIVSGENADSEDHFSNESIYPNTYHVFSDELFNGKEYPLKFSATTEHLEYFPEYASIVGPQPTLKIVVELQSISKSYYLYLKSRPSCDIEDIFAEPIQIHCNVHDGIGILGSYTNCGTKELNLSF